MMCVHYKCGHKNCDARENVQRFTPSKHIYPEKPWEYEGYHQACQQEVTEGLSPPTSPTPI
uniref:Uncharacterized protein n=1 Tax=Rhizophora mucronata TaxID=61149 RepID=A0A2P2P268_RHIMU